MGVSREEWVEIFGVKPSDPDPVIRLNAPRECDHLIKNPEGWGFIPCNKKNTIFQGGHWLCGEHRKERKDGIKNRMDR